MAIVMDTGFAKIPEAEGGTEYPLWCGFSKKPSNFGFFAL